MKENTSARVLMGVPNSQLTTNVSAKYVKYQLTTMFAGYCHWVISGTEKRQKIVFLFAKLCCFH